MEAAPQHQNAFEEFKFKLLCHLQVLPPNSRLDCKNPLKLVATCSGHGLIFVGTDVGFQCIQTNTIIALHNERANKREKIASYPRYECNLGGPSTHLDVNSDGRILAVAYVEQNIPVLGFYLIESFGTPNAAKKWSVRLSSTPGVRVADAQWNPGISNMFGVVTTDGAAMVIDLTNDSYNINSIPPNSQSLCLSWSPKGKRVVIGSKGGSIIQYMPELKVVKAIPLPAAQGKNISVISLKWLSNTQYIAVLKDGQDQNGSAAVVVINSPQNQPQRFINYDDICCGALTDRPEHHFIHIPSWNLVILGNSNSLDSALLRQNGDLWTQWIIDDTNLAQLPLTEDHLDVYNIGMAFDLSPKHPIPIDENRKIDPAPLLLMYSHAGVLCLFHALNFTPGAPKLCIQPQELPSNYFVEKSSVGAPAAAVATPPASAQNVQSTPMNSPFGMAGFGAATFGMAQPTQPAQSFQTPPASQPAQLSFSSQSTGATMPTFSFANTTTEQTIPKSIPNQQFGAFQQIPQPQKQKTDQPLKPMFGTSNVPSTSSPSILNTPTTTKASFDSFGFGISKDAAPKLQAQSKPELPTYSQATQPPLPPTSQPAPPPPPPPDKTQEAKDNEKSAQDLELAQKQMEKAIVKALIKESKSVEKEFNDFRKKMSKLNMTVGEDSLLKSIPIKVADLEIFEQDLSETTSTQSSEVNVLRCNLVELYGWVENIKAKDRQIKSQRYLECFESQSSDPIVKKHLRAIEQHMNFFESQVKQATACLDSIWNNYNKSKNKNTIDIPNLESIYEVIVNQTCVLAAHNALFNEYQTKVHKTLKHAKKIPQVIEYSSPSYNSRTGVSDLDVLADKLLNTKIDTKSPSKSYRETSCRYIVLANAKKKLPPSKENVLKNWHTSHKVITTKATKPYTLNYDDESFYESLIPEEEPKVEKDVRSSQNSSQKILGILEKANISPSVSVTKKPVADNIFGAKASDNTKTIQDKSFGLMYEVVTTNAAPQKYSSGITVQVGTTSSFTISPVSTSGLPSRLLANTTKPLTSFTTLTSSTVASQSKATTVDSGVLNKLTPKTATTTAPTKTGFSSFFGNQTQTSSIFGASSFITSTSIPSLTKPNTTTTTETVVSTTTSAPFTSPSSSFNFNSNSMSTPKTTASMPTLSFPISSLLSATKDEESEKPNKPSETEKAGKPSESEKPNNPSESEKPNKPPEPEKPVKPSESANEFKTPEKTTQADTSLLLSALTSSVAISPPVLTTTSSPVSKGLFSSTMTTTATAIATTGSIFGSNSFSSPSLFTSPTTNVFGGSSFFSSNTTTATTPASTTEVVTSASLFGGFGGMSLTTAASTVTTTGTTSTTPSAFTVTSTTQSSLFGGATVFGAVTTSSQFSSANVFGSPSTGSASIFGGAQTSASLFGGTSTTTTTAASVFGTPTTTASVFGTPTTTASVFGPPTTTAASLFGAPSTPVTTNASVFGAPSTPPTTAAALFATPATAATTTSIFAAPATPSTTAAPLFGTSSTPVTTSTSIFGAPTTPVTASPSLFGAPSAPSTTASINQPIFGGAAATTSIFGSPSTVTTTSASVFGASPSSPSSSFFASATLANTQTQQQQQPQPFGVAQQSQPFGGSSFFQSTTPTANVFGGPSTFGQKQTTTASSIFGGSPSFSQPTQSGNIFGNTSTPNKFASPSGTLFGGNSFTSPQPQQPSFSSGQTGGLFGSSNAFQTNQSNVSQSGFGSPPAFGSSGSSIFGGQATFGSAPSFGGGATFGSPGKVFGESPTASAVSFGSPTQQSSTFENLANQNTISFGNLAQNQPPGFNSSFGSPSPPQQPAFANRPNTNSFGGSSFSSWR